MVYTIDATEVVWIGSLVSLESGERVEDDTIDHDATKSAINLKSVFSDPLTFNTLHIPEVNLTGDYHYYVPQEDNDEYNERKDQQDPDAAPMFVKVDWVPLTELMETTTERPPSTYFHGVEVSGAYSISIEAAEIANHDVDPTAIIIIRK